MNDTNQRAIVIAVAVAVALAVVASPALGAITMDNESTDSTTTSDWIDGTTVTDIHNDSKDAYLEFDSANATNSSSAAIYLTVNDSNSPQDGDQIYSTTRDITATNATGNQYSIDTNITHEAAFRDLEHDANESVTVDVEVVVNESETSEENTTFQITADSDETNARVAVSDGEPDVEEEGTIFGLSLPFSDDATSAAAHEQDINVTTNTDEIAVAAPNQTTADAIDVSTPDSAGDLSTKLVVFVNGDPVPVYGSGTTTSDVDYLDSDETYATADTNGVVTVQNVNDTVSSTSDPVTIRIEANDAVGFFQTRAMLTDRGAGFGTAASSGFAARDPNGDPFDEDSVVNVGS